MTAIHLKKQAGENRFGGEFEFRATAAPAEPTSSQPSSAEKSPPAFSLEIPPPHPPLSKFFRSISQISSAFLPDFDEAKRLKDRRQAVQDFLREIHPPETRVGRRSAKELAKDPFVQTLNRVDGEVRDHVTKLLRDPVDSALYEAPHLEKFIQKYFEVREELLEKDPSYLRQRSLEAGIERIGQWEAEFEALGEAELEKYRDNLLRRHDTIRWIREDLEAEISDIQSEEESRRLADFEASANWGDGETDEPAEDVADPPSEALLAARQKLAFFQGLIEELEIWELGADSESPAS
ncbi:MAG TPA: hypothetical protein VJP40_09370, partial [bacterium]|nr:hypothetical protein [bacterium]